ncbi:hypothetical protein [Vibrio bivalvicida]|uniref:Tat pathway signal protein n=1 Tax=Vibrio bivalvicida TaxID=1276888 RepID=A0ABV4MC60_9VIBR
MSTTLSVKGLRHTLIQHLKLFIPDKTIVRKETGSFDYLMSRRAFLGNAGKLAAVAALVNAGLPPSAWADENPAYTINDPALQLTEAEKQAVREACKMSLTGELMDEQLLFKTDGQITSFENHHGLLRGIHHTPYIQTMPNEVGCDNPLAAGEHEMVYINNWGNVMHRFRDPDSSHGFKEQQVSDPRWSYANCDLYTLSHPDNGQIVGDRIVGAWIILLVDRDYNMLFSYTRTQILSADGSQEFNSDTGWKENNLSGNANYFKNIYYSPSYKRYDDSIRPDSPYIHTWESRRDDGGIGPVGVPIRSSVSRFRDIEEIANNPEKVFEVSTFSWDFESSPQKYAYREADIYLVDAGKDDNECTFILTRDTDYWKNIFQTFKAPWASDKVVKAENELITLGGGGHEVDYSAPIYPVIYGNPRDKVATQWGVTLMTQSGDICHLTRDKAERYPPAVSVIIANYLNKSSQRYNAFLRQTNHFGVQSLFGMTSAGEIFQRRQKSRRLNPDDYLSPFDIDAGYEDWQQLDKGATGILSLPFTNEDSEYLTAKQKPEGMEYVYSTVANYTLTHHEEEMMVSMSPEEVNANISKGIEQITDTFYHGEIQVTNIYGHPVGPDILVELRASRPTRLIDNQNAKGHSIARNKSVVLKTNAMGRVIVSIKAIDMKAPTLFARLYDKENYLSGAQILLSTKGGMFGWNELNPDYNAHKRLADKNHTSAAALQKEGLLKPENAKDDYYANMIRTAGSRLTTVSLQPALGSNLFANINGEQLNPLTRINYIDNNSYQGDENLPRGIWTINVKQGKAVESTPELVGSFWHSIGHLFHHIVHAIEKGVKAVIDGVAREITKITLEVGDAVKVIFHYASGAVKFILDTVEHVAKAIYSLIKIVGEKIADIASKIVQFIKLFFNFPDIFALTRSLNRGVRQDLNSVTDDVDNYTDVLKQGISALRRELHSSVEAKCNRLSNSAQGYCNLDSSSKDVMNKYRENACTYNFAKNKFYADVQAYRLASQNNQGNTATLDDLLAKLGDVAFNKGPRVPYDIIKTLFDAVVGGFNKETLCNVLHDLETLADDGLDVAVDIIDIVRDMLKLSRDAIGKALDASVPVLGWLLRLVGLDLTWGDLFGLIIAVPLHSLYATLTGKSLKSIDFNTPDALYSDAPGGVNLSAVNVCFVVAGYSNVTLSVASAFLEGDNSGILGKFKLAAGFTALAQASCAASKLKSGSKGAIWMMATTNLAITIVATGVTVFVSRAPDNKTIMFPINCLFFLTKVGTAIGISASKVPAATCVMAWAGTSNALLKTAASFPDSTAEAKVCALLGAAGINFAAISAFTVLTFTS